MAFFLKIFMGAVILSDIDTLLTSLGESIKHPRQNLNLCLQRNQPCSRVLPIQYTGQVRFGGRRDNSIDFRAWATPQEVTQSLVVGPRVRDPEQPRRTSFRDGLPCRKKDDQKLKGDFHLH